VEAHSRRGWVGSVREHLPQPLSSGLFLAGVDPPAAMLSAILMTSGFRGAFGACSPISLSVSNRRLGPVFVV
jgi:hypothetical protein